MQQLELFIKEKKLAYPDTQLKAIIYYIAQMDIEMLSACLEGDKTYQDLPKFMFLHKLSKAFEKFENAGDKVLSTHKGVCGSCTKGCDGLTFLGKQGEYIDLLFVVANQEIKDIYECSNLVNLKKVNRKLNRVYIEPLMDIFPFEDDSNNHSD